MRATAVRSLATVLIAGLALGGCGEGGPPPPEIPGLEAPRGPSELTVSLQVTFTRDEAPVRVPRTVVLPLDPDGPPHEALLLETALGELLAGPTEDEREQGITSFFSDATRDLLLEARVEGDSAMVDFGDLPPLIPNAGSSTGSFHFLAELNGTVFALPGIARVEYRMEGSCEAFWNFLQRSCQQVRSPLDT
jgi:hypothetical protein